ncbi:MAG: hypothetical protein EZS28_024180 [Streblomastix strix]|uniref:Uncharacterized protein n=1 Tax=Streblomastix strix TaxID=222440 RepID=A0A5J4VCZ5_9EUKA|nr:MAG: hypothetical protein EZS28_024180 [Streblomastix strix]
MTKLSSKSEAQLKEIMNCNGMTIRSNQSLYSNYNEYPRLISRKYPQMTLFMKQTDQTYSQEMVVGRSSRLQPTKNEDLILQTIDNTSNENHNLQTNDNRNEKSLKKTSFDKFSRSSEVTANYDSINYFMNQQKQSQKAIRPMEDLRNREKDLKGSKDQDEVISNSMIDQPEQLD